MFAGDSKVDMGKRRTMEQMGGDIAVIASGGGASLINMDALLLAGGKPANYTEYSGNPAKEVVTALTKQVFAQPGIKACWVIGGTANFTDIYETMSGFVEGLRQVSPKPNFPFVIRLVNDTIFLAGDCTPLSIERHRSCSISHLAATAPPSCCSTSAT